MTTDIAVIYVDDGIRNAIENYIGTLNGRNPYVSSQQDVEEAAHSIWTILASGRSSTEELCDFIATANTAGNVPPVLIKNFAREPSRSWVMPDDERGFDYANNEKDRMKKYFFTEWASWIVATLLNHENTVHPSEHGGGNRFHLVSPISSDGGRLRDVGASTGGGKFYQHSDATVFNDFPDENAFLERLALLDTDIDRLESALGRPRGDIVAQVLCRKYVRVDATMLAGIYNKDTMTHIITPMALQHFLAGRGYDDTALRRLAGMPVAQIAGPADGDISGFIGTVTPPLQLDPSGAIFGTCINLAEGRMKYVGKSDEDEALFERFVYDARQAPVTEILIEQSDALFFPNAAYGTQQNVTHGRGALKDSDYRIEVEPDVFVRRAHCRQYLVSRFREGKPAFISKH